MNDVGHQLPEPRRSGWLPHPVLSTFCGVVWLLANNSLDPGHVILAVVLGVGMPLLTHEFWPTAPRIRRPMVAVRLFLVFAYDVVVANFNVARLVLGPNDRLRSAFLLIPLDLEDRFGIAILASMITLTPGTVSCNVSRDHKMLVVHALDAADMAVAVSEIKQRYEAPLREILGC
jgi:multicomponent K+:H+ antiporter subunit E